jgi:ABC-type uncharacterized transport system substrate-binding protein
MLAAVQAETRTIPIVFVNVSDPVGTGLVASLAHPGGNITGFTNFEYRRQMAGDPQGDRTHGDPGCNHR